MKNFIQTKVLNQLLILLICLWVFQSCAPVYSDLQSARMVGKDRVELTPSYTTVDFFGDGETQGMQNQIGLNVAYGITDKIDIRAKYERIWGKEGEISDGLDIAGIGPKFSIVENKVAFFIPLGRAFGEDSEDSWELQPTALFTLPAVKEKIDLTVSTKYLILFCEDCDNLIAFNFGASFSDDLNKWAVRPEYGLLYNPGEDGHFGQFSIGLSYTFGQYEKEKIIPD